MPDRKYTYQVEIDATQAKQAAQTLRQLFEKELGQLRSPAGMTQEIGQAAAPVAQLGAELQKIAKIDLTKPIDDLQLEISQTAQQLDRLRAEYDRMTTTGGMGGKSGAEAANYQAYIEEIRRMVSDSAANAMASTGQYLNVGQRGAQFVQEHEDDYLSFAKDYHSKNRDTQDRARQSAQEREEIARLELEMYDAQLQITQAERTIAERRLATYEQRIGSIGDDDDGSDLVRMMEAANDAQQEIRQLSEEEQGLLRAIADANDNLAASAAAAKQEIAKAEQAAARKRGELAGSAAGGEGVGYTQQTALTVSKAAVTNAKELAASMRETADLSERIVGSTKKIADAEIGRIKSEKESYTIKEQQRRLTEEAIRDADRRKAVDTEAARAATEAARAATEQQKQATQAAQQQKIAQQGVTATQKAEATVRTQSSRAEASAAIEASRSAGTIAREEQKRQTMTLREQINQRNQMQRTAAQTQRTGSGTVFGMTPGMIGGTIAGALGVYGIDQATRTAYSAARDGAQAERTAATFEQVAQRMNVSAQAMIRAIREASRETIGDMDAMSLGAQLLAQKWAGSNKNIVADTAELVQASRRLAQLYPDEQGRAFSTMEVFSRLLKFVREGNKELVDQFGLSNQRIADSLGISVEGMASATGAADRFRGLITVLREDMDRLGPAMLTSADKFEQAEARISAARLRIGKAMAEPIADFTENAAGVLEGLQIRAGANDVNMTRTFLEQRAESFGTQNLPAPAELTQLLDLFRQLDDATALSADNTRIYSASLSAMAGEILRNNGATDAQRATMERMSKEIALAAAGQDAWSRVMAITTREALEQDGAMLALAGTMGQYQAMYEDGNISLTTYNQLSGQLAATLFELARAANTLAPELAAVNAQLAAVPKSAGLLGGPIAGAGALQSPSWFNLRQEEDAFRTDRINAQTDRDATARAEAKREQERIASEAQRQWESAAKAAQSEWEAAAKATADEFKSALEGVPGLFGTSSVTAEDMKLAEYGLYEPKADEYLRQLRDEVTNKVDYENVDIRDAASRMGVDPNLPAQAILAMFEKAWADSSLFSNGANLDLINKDAILNELGRQEASKSGKNSILAYFGLADEDLQIGDQGGRDAFSKMLGLDDKGIIDAGAQARDKFITGFTSAGTAATTTTQGDFLAPIVQSMEGSLSAGDAADRIYAIGGSLVGRIYAGFLDAANNLAWGQPIIESLASSVAPQVYDMLSARFDD